jgi:hypothetical protein
MVVFLAPPMMVTDLTLLVGAELVLTKIPFEV